MRVQNVAEPVYAPNSKGGPKADLERYPYMEKWEASGEFMHAAYTPHKEGGRLRLTRHLGAEGHGRCRA
jgi:catalase